MNAGEYAFIIFISIWLILSVMGNFFTVLVIVRNKKMWNLTSILICNLEISDIILAAIVLPMRVHDISHTHEYFEPAFLCTLINCLPIFCISSSIYSMVAISVERYRAIVLQIATPFTKKLCFMIILGIWMVATIIMTPTILEFSIHEVTENNVTYRVCQPGNLPYEFSVFNGFYVLILSYLGPQLVLYVYYGRLLTFLWRKSKQIQPANNGTLATSAVSKTKVKILKMLVLVAVLFSLSWIPYFTLLIIAKITDTDMSSEASSYQSLMQMTLAAFSTSYNIVIYLIFNTAFKKAALRLLGCKKAAADCSE